MASQPPLKPVWPVRKTLLSRQNSGLIAKLSKALFLKTKGPQANFFREEYPLVAKIHCAHRP
jgi:hypothetical protein